MQNISKTKSFGDYTQLIRRRWQFFAVIAPTAILLAVFLAYVLPVSYRASGAIMLEPSSIPANLVPSTVAGTGSLSEYAGQQLELVRRRVMSRENLIKLVQEVDPYPDLTTATPGQKASLISASSSVELVDPISLEPSLDSTAFMIYYENPNPAKAAEIADRLVNLFVTFNHSTRAQQAAEAYRFLQSQATGLEKSLRGMEQRLAQFKAKYGDALPDAENRNLAGIDRTQRDLDNLQREIHIAQERESLLALQLNEISPSITASVGDWRTELAKQRAELALAEQRYTKEHPDVKRLRRSIAELAAQGGAGESASRARPDNPEYLRIRSQLDSVRAELSALRASAGRTQGERFRFEKNLATAPNVESEYIQLVREHGNSMSRYEDIQTKLKAAALAQNLETEALGERFAKLRGATVPQRPFSPNRLGIILLGFVLGVAIATAAAVVRDVSDPTVRGSDDLESVIGLSPIGALPVILNPADLRHRRMLWGSYAAVYATAAAIVAFSVVISR